MSRIRVRDLNRQVTFQDVTRVSDGSGGYTENYANSVTVWCSVIAGQKSQNVYQEGVLVDKLWDIMYVRYKDITPKVSQRVLYTVDGVQRILYVDNVKEVDDQRRFWVVTLVDSKNG